MSSTIVYQGSSQLTENKPLRLKLAAPKSLEPESSNTKEDTNLDSGGWNFLQSLSNSSQKTFNTEDNIHPSLKLSQKSLELCTENLGSETGSDDTLDIDILSSTSMQSRSTKSKTRGHMSSLAKKAKTRSFPPPLTTISGSNSLQVRPHREGGRLIIEAVEAPSSRACFEAERSHGRLQLRFLKNCEFFYNQMMSSESEYTEENDNIVESESETETETEEDRSTSKAEEDHFEHEKNSRGNIIKVDQERKKDKDGIRQDVEVRMGRDNFQRHNSRGCKESGHGGNNNKLDFCNWECFWVAT